MNTLYLDPQSWDLVLDTAGNIALAKDPQATVIFESAVTYSYILAAHAGKITKTGCHVGISENGIVGSKTVHWVAIGY